MEATFELKTKERFKLFSDTLHHIKQLNKSIWKISH